MLQVQRHASLFIRITVCGVQRIVIRPLQKFSGNIAQPSQQIIDVNSEAHIALAELVGGNRCGSGIGWLLKIVSEISKFASDARVV